MSGVPEPPEVRVLRGDPRPEEVAAVVAALAEARSQDAQRRRGELPAWLRAARVEGVGGRPVATPTEEMSNYVDISSVCR